MLNLEKGHARDIGMLDKNALQLFQELNLTASFDKWMF